MAFFLEQLLARLPLDLLKVKRLLIDGVKKEETPVRAMRLAMSSVLRRRGMGRTPILRAEPAISGTAYKWLTCWLGQWSSGRPAVETI